MMFLVNQCTLVKQGFYYYDGWCRYHWLCLQKSILGLQSNVLEERKAVVPIGCFIFQCCTGIACYSVVWLPPNHGVRDGQGARLTNNSTNHQTSSTVVDMLMPIKKQVEHYCDCYHALGTPIYSKFDLYYHRYRQHCQFKSHLRHMSQCLTSRGVANKR